METDGDVIEGVEMQCVYAVSSIRTNAHSHPGLMGLMLAK